MFKLLRTSHYTHRVVPYFGCTRPKETGNFPAQLQGGHGQGPREDGAGNTLKAQSRQAIYICCTISSCSPNIPFHVLDAHLFARFLVVVKPLALPQVDAWEDCRRLQTICLPLSLKQNQQRLSIQTQQACAYFGSELGELEASAIKLDDVDFRRGRAMHVGLGRFLYGRAGLSLRGPALGLVSRA